MNAVNLPRPFASKWKPSRALIHTIIFLSVVLIVCVLPLVQSFLLKNLAPSEYGLIKGKGVDFELTYKELLFFATVVFALWMLSASLRLVKRRTLRILLSSIAVFYLFVVGVAILIDVIYYFIFAYRMTFSSVQTMLNTNSNEAGEFMEKYINSTGIVAIIVFVFVCAFIIYKRHWFAQFISTTAFFRTTFLLSALGATDFYQFAHSRGNGLHNVRYWDITIGEYNEYREFNRQLQAEKSGIGASKEYNDFYSQDTVQKTIVLVISESMNKGHMSLYGYPRTTTPHLDANRNIFNFKNCVTPAVLTIEAVPKLFFNGYLEKKINLVALLNKLGYETSWISNQSGWGKTDGPIVLLSEVCKQTFFTDSLADDDKSNASLHYDDEVLKTFDHLMSTPSKKSRFIVLHLMGCHFDYEKRYPVGRGVFTTKPPAKTAVNSVKVHAEINQYDNAVLYHDSVVDQVLTIFHKYGAGTNSGLLFVADHGEELYEYRNHSGHSFPPNRSTAEVPFFASFSPKFLETYPAIHQTLKQRSNTAYNTEDNFYTLLHLLNINSRKHHKLISRNAFFSGDYDSTRTRLVMGCDYSQLR
jgi:heptose-I-phosphate ethanolaminephosphotransferase